MNVISASSVAGAADLPNGQTLQPAPSQGEETFALVLSQVKPNKEQKHSRPSHEDSESEHVNEGLHQPNELLLPDSALSNVNEHDVDTAQGPESIAQFNEQGLSAAQATEMLPRPLRSSSVMALDQAAQPQVTNPRPPRSIDDRDNAVPDGFLRSVPARMRQEFSVQGALDSTLPTRLAQLAPTRTGPSPITGAEPRLNAIRISVHAKIQAVAGNDLALRSVDPEAFIRHVDQSLQVSSQIGAERTIDKLRDSVTRHGELVRIQGQTEGSNYISAMPAPSISAANNQTGTIPTFTLTPHIEHEGWAKAMAQQVISLTRHTDQSEQLAILRLDPPELGPIRVMISMTDGVANAVFGSANAQVRQVIENSLPELAKAFSQAGIDLGQTDVNSGDSPAFASSDSWGANSESSKVKPKAVALDAVNEGRVSTQTSHNGLVNTFA